MAAPALAMALENSPSVKPTALRAATFLQSSSAVKPRLSVAITSALLSAIQPRRSDGPQALRRTIFALAAFRHSLARPWPPAPCGSDRRPPNRGRRASPASLAHRSEEHTSELQPRF